ncbi:MAG: hypothetical protein V7637_829 [Mycobacteriales bacterium]|jgi:hypothetical protein
MSKRFLRREDVLAMLASYGDRRPDEVGEELGSLELTWLIAQVEQRYSVLLDLDDDVFASMSTVTGALDRLRAALDQPSTVDDSSSGVTGG